MLSEWRVLLCEKLFRWEIVFTNWSTVVAKSAFAQNRNYGKSPNSCIFLLFPAGIFANRSSDAPHYGLKFTWKAIVIRFLIMFGFKLKIRVKRLYYRALLNHSGFSKLLLSLFLTCNLKMLTIICKKKLRNFFFFLFFVYFFEFLVKT